MAARLASRWSFAAIVVFTAMDPVVAAQDLARPRARKNQGPGEVITPPARGEWQADLLLVGATAPDFTLMDSAGKSLTTLSSFRGKKPVVLIFGSCT